MTDHDVQMLEYLGLGRSNKEIARALRMSENTVKNQFTGIYFKLDVQDRFQAMLRSHALGLINLNQLAKRFSDRKVA